MTAVDPSIARESPWRFCTAPMMEWSDRHCRYFWRCMSQGARLYTEMITTGALLHGDRDRLLAFDPLEQPLALQLGGSHPQELARCAALAEEYGFSEVNLNCGCPSDRVRNGSFGACLMASPDTVAASVDAMRSACSIPVTVKHRLGIDEMECYEEFERFVMTVASGGCEVFIVHARKAWLKGLSPRENREVPPLRYDWVYRLKREHPELTVVLNGGIQSLADCEAPLSHLDGVMVGRAAYQNPAMLLEVDSRLLHRDSRGCTAESTVMAMLPYIERELAAGAHLNHITRHMLGLFQGRPGARRFRRHLSEHAHKPGAGVATLLAALDHLRPMAA